MRCSDFEHRLDDLLDQRLTPTSDRDLIAHANVCDACRETLGTMTSVLNVYVGCSTPDVSATVAGGTFGRPWQVLVAIAATMLVACGTFWRVTSTSFTSANTSHDVAPAMALDVESVDVPFVAARQEQPERKLASRQSESSTSAYQPLVGIGLLSRFDWSQASDSIPLANLAQPFSDQFDETWTTVVADGVVPVQESMSTTLDVIRRSLTSSRS